MPLLLMLPTSSLCDLVDALSYYGSAEDDLCVETSVDDRVTLHTRVLCESFLTIFVFVTRSCSLSIITAQGG